MGSPYTAEQIKFADDGFPITPGAGALGQRIRGLYVAVAGDVTVTTIKGNSVTYGSLAAGIIHPIGATHVTAATATGIVGIPFAGVTDR